MKGACFLTQRLQPIIDTKTWHCWLQKSMARATSMQRTHSNDQSLEQTFDICKLELAFMCSSVHIGISW